MRLTTSHSWHVAHTRLFCFGCFIIVLYGLTDQFLFFLKGNVYLYDLLRVGQVVCGFSLVFLFPGIVFAASLPGCEKIGGTILFFSGLGIQYLSLAAVGTIAKLAGIKIDRNIFLAIEIILFIGAALTVRRRRVIEVIGDVSGLLVVVVASAVVLISLLYWQRMKFHVDDCWLREKIEQIEFQKDEIVPHAVTVVCEGGAKAESGRAILPRGVEASFSLNNHTASAIPCQLIYLVRSTQPGQISVVCNGREIAREQIPQSLYKAGGTHVFGLQAIISSTARLSPGRSVVVLVFAPADERNVAEGAWEIQDFSGLSKREFLEVFRESNSVLNIGHMYDIREIRTFAVGLATKPYLWGDRFSTGGREGYIAMLLPASHYQDMMIMAAVGDFPFCANLAFLARLFILVLAVGYLSMWGKSGMTPPGIAILTAVTIAFASTALTSGFQIFPDTFLLMNYFIAIIFLLARWDWMFLLFCSIASLSRYVGIELVVLTMIAYLLIFRDRRRTLSLGLLYAIIICSFALGVYQLGRHHGLLGVWAQEFRGEYFEKSFHEIPEGFTALDNLRNLFRWWIVGSCFVPLWLRVRKGDRLSLLCTTVMLAFLLHMVSSAGFRVYRVHYVASLTFLATTVLLRSWYCVESAMGQGRMKHLRVFFVAVAVVSMAWLMVSPFEYPEYTTLWLRGYFALNSVVQCVSDSILSHMSHCSL